MIDIKQMYRLIDTFVLCHLNSCRKVYRSLFSSPATTVRRHCSFVSATKNAHTGCFFVMREQCKDLVTFANYFIRAPHSKILSYATPPLTSSSYLLRYARSFQVPPQQCAGTVVSFPQQKTPIRAVFL